MWIDVQDWQRFFSSPMGHTYIHLLQSRLRDSWPTAPHQKVLGLGYALPYLDMQLTENPKASCIAAMPNYLGACQWPTDAPNRVALVDETQLPFADNYFDLIVVAHGLEFSGHQHSFLREIWRILNNQGKLVVISANKLSLWSSIGKTPLTRGGSFTSSQLLYLLQSNLFIPTRFQQELFMPPFRWCAQHRPFARLLNTTIGKLLPSSGGIVIAEALKQTIIPPQVKQPLSWLTWFQGKPQKTTSECPNSTYPREQS